MSDPAAEMVAPGDGVHMVNPIGGSMTLKLRDAQTAGAYSIHDNVLPPRTPGPRPHVHRHHDEVFYVISGRLTVRAGAATYTAEPGAYIVIPRGTVHQPSNPSDEPAHVLLIFSPGGMDDFFTQAAGGKMPLQAMPVDAEAARRLAEFTHRYGYEFAEF